MRQPTLHVYKVAGKRQEYTQIYELEGDRLWYMFITWIDKDGLM